jgi:hypothetical protein
MQRRSRFYWPRLECRRRSYINIQWLVTHHDISRIADPTTAWLEFPDESLAKINIKYSEDVGTGETARAA